MRRAALPALLFFVSLCDSSAFAQDARLAKVSGSVSLRGFGRPAFVPAKGGEDLIFGDAVKVEKGGLAHLVFEDGAAVLLREECLLVLEGSEKGRTLAFEVGEFLVGLKKRLRGTFFRVRTPAAVAAVRGTLFWGRSDEKQTTTYAGFGRTVEIMAQGKLVTLGPGETVTVRFGKAPSAPKPSTISFSYAKKFAIGGSLQGVGALREKPQ